MENDVICSGRFSRKIGGREGVTVLNFPSILVVAGCVYTLFY